MNFFDQESILPGVVTNIISDYNEGYDTSKFGTTSSVVVLGTAFNGPVGKLISIYSPEHAKYVFGPSFDFKTRTEAPLVSEIKNAWDRGCRTIYAVRVTGKEIYKDFQFASDVNCKLRVSGIFPNNANKDVFFQYNAADTLSEKVTGTEATIKIFKPATRATIEEKMLGRVTKENSMLVNSVKLKSNWNVTAETRLVDFIKLFNEYKNNNVIRLSIVDDKGNDVTETELAQGLVFKDLLPGVYFIGRDRNSSKIIAKTDVQTLYIPEDKRSTIYETFAGDTFKVLKNNTDITRDLPIYHKDVTQLNYLIGKVEEVTMSKLFDFLEIPGKVDYIWLKDKKDYEEVRPSDFEMYKKLGCGYATTARVQVREDAGKVTICKVVEVVGDNDPNKIVPMTDGIYSILENLKADYRILAAKSADVEIKGVLPNKREFLISNPKSTSIFSKTIRVTPKLERRDLRPVAKKYNFALNKCETVNKEEIMSNLYNRNGVYSVSKFALPTTDVSKLKVEDFQNGDLILVTDKLQRFVDGKFVELKEFNVFGTEFTNKLLVAGTDLYEVDSTSKDELKFKKMTDAKTLSNAKYIAVENSKEVAVYKIDVEDNNVIGLAPLALLRDILSEYSNIYAMIVPSIDTDGNILRSVEIKASSLNITTLEEFIYSLNEDRVLGELFSFDLDPTIDDIKSQASILPSGVKGEVSVFANPTEGTTKVKTETSTIGTSTADEAFEDRTAPIYDKSLYIPFRTNDNFARQLAQHCFYTGIKTGATHGIIGCSKIMSNNLKTIDEKVDKLVKTDLNLYAKRLNGNDMLDKNNMPFPIGRVLSVTFFQNPVNTGDNYTYISNGAGAYAGMVSNLPLSQSSTAQPINIENTTFELSNYQLGRLTQAGYVTIKNSQTQGYIVTDGVTMAPVTSPFRRLASSRIVNAIDGALRSVGEPFIGKANTISNRNSLETAIKSTLDKMVGSLIEAYDFRLSNEKGLKEIGIIEILYNIIVMNEIREIRNSVTVKKTI